MRPNINKWKPQFGLAILIFVLIGVAVISRFVLADWPNFKPVCAIAIFLGFLSGKLRFAMLAIVVVMIMSDAIIGFYEWPLMISVYSSLMLACSIGYCLRTTLARTEKIWLRSIAIGIAATSASVLFFICSNAAVWWIGWYPANLSGLLQAFTAGIPFFKFTLAGNLCFTMTLFATHFALQSWRERLYTTTVSFPPPCQEVNIR